HGADGAHGYDATRRRATGAEAVTHTATAPRGCRTGPANGRRALRICKHPVAPGFEGARTGDQQLVVEHNVQSPRGGGTWHAATTRRRAPHDGRRTPTIAPRRSRFFKRNSPWCGAS